VRRWSHRSGTKYRRGLCCTCTMSREFCVPGIKHDGHRRSGNAPLNLEPGSFSVSRLLVWPGMGLSVSFSNAPPAESRQFRMPTASVCPTVLGFFPRDFPLPPRRGSFGVERRTCGRMASVAPAGRFCKAKPSIKRGGVEQAEERWRGAP